jgi:hypothetical protein
MFKKIIRKSCFGTEYSIPENMLNLFAHLDERVENAEWNSDDEERAIDEFRNHFGEFEKSYGEVR